MKPIKISVSVLAFSGIFLFFSSCNSGNEKKVTDAIEKTDSISAPKKESTTSSSNLMIIKHKVADFAKWLTLYQSHDSLRLAYGLHNYGVSRGIDDTNMVMVALKMDDINKAKAFAALPDLKARMQQAGVIEVPIITYYNRQSLFLSTNDPSTRVMISHKVKDWAAWKNEFDKHKQARKDAGLTDRSVGYEVDNDKMVTIVAVVGDLQKAREFFASSELKNKMDAAGVEGPPTIFLYNLVKSF
jgi:hypothetical protein